MVPPSWIPNLPIGIFAIAVGVGGVYVSINPPPKGRKQIVCVALFVVLSFMECAIIWKQTYLSDQAAAENRTAIGKLENDNQLLKSTIQLNQINNSSDLGYLKGKLDQAIASPKERFDMDKFTSALTKSNAELAAHEAERVSDSKLWQQAMEYADKLREYEVGRDKARAYLASGMPSPGMTKDQAEAFNQEKIRQMSEQYEAISGEFRTKFLPRALDLRDQMEERLNERKIPLPKPSTPFELIAFDGVLGGRYPITHAANYLDALARLLSR
jgi:hypothetical protein